MTNVLVLGGCGFIGSNLAGYWMDKGADVTVYDNLSRPGGGARKNLKTLQKRYKGQGRFHFLLGDIRDVGGLLLAVSDKDIIFHVAAQTAMTTSIDNPDEDFSVNAQGTFNVLETVRRSGGNPVMVYTSTNKVYGDLTKREVKLVEEEKRWDFANHGGIDESYPLDFEGCYGCSKGTGDSYFLDYARTFGLRTVVFRMSGIYGTSQYATEDQGWVNWITGQALRHQPMTIYGDGKQVRDILYITDLLDMFYRVVTNPDKVKGEVFNIGGGRSNSISVLELLDLLKRGLNISPSVVKYADWRRADQKVYITDYQKAKTVLGWEPKVSAGDGIASIAKWIAETDLFKE